MANRVQTKRNIVWSKVTEVQARGIASDEHYRVLIEADNSEIIARALRKQIVKALEEVGITAEGDVADVTPVDTGRLKNSITHELSGEDAVKIGTNVEYAPYVERRKSYLVRTMNEHGKDYRSHLEKALRNAPEP